jgi:hypothetical protein
MSGDPQIHLFAVHMTPLGADGEPEGPARMVTIADLVADNADDPHDVIAALWQLRENIRAGDWDGAVTLGGGAAGRFCLTPVHPGEIALSTLDEIALGADLDGQPEGAIQ